MKTSTRPVFRFWPNLCLVCSPFLYQFYYLTCWSLWWVIPTPWLYQDLKKNGSDRWIYKQQFFIKKYEKRNEYEKLAPIIENHHFYIGNILSFFRYSEFFAWDFCCCLQCIMMYVPSLSTALCWITKQRRSHSIQNNN